MGNYLTHLSIGISCEQHQHNCQSSDFQQHCSLQIKGKERYLSLIRLDDAMILWFVDYYYEI